MNASVSPPEQPAAPRTSSEGERGALASVPVRARPIASLPEWLFAPAAGMRARDPSNSPRRRKRGTQLTRLGPIDWFQTLLARPRPRPDEVRRRQRKLRREPLWIVSIDCSASMLQSAAAGVAKGVAGAIAARAASYGARLGVISFGGADARRATPGAGALSEAIDALEVGGGTPLRHALELGLALERDALLRGGAIEPRWFMLTDGRSRERIDDLAARSTLRPVFVLDCELGPVRLGRARRLAEALGGSYVHVETWLERPQAGGS